MIASWLAAGTAVAGEGEPPVPAGRDPGGVAVALIDSGINYTLPHIVPRLARDAGGKLLGHDFDDGDNEPFDIVPGREGAAFALHHGTSVASILVREAPDVRLVPYRFDPRDFRSFARIVEHIAKGPARIATMALGGSRQEDWQLFAEAAAAHPEILFIVSAGNDGRDIDQEPVYPASFDLQNTIVVTSSDDFGRIPGDSNWGVTSVDISTPGEQITTRDHRGAIRQASGSSYAVPRIAALAARLKEANPAWSTQALKSAVLAFAVSPRRATTPRTRHGWIVNPALAGPQVR